MSSLTLPSQSFRPASPSVIGSSVRALASAFATLTAPLRRAVDAVSRRLLTAGANAEARELRARAQAHLETNPSFAADLMAAAQQIEPSVEPA